MVKRMDKECTTIAMALCTKGASSMAKRVGLELLRFPIKPKSRPFGTKLISKVLGKFFIVMETTFKETIIFPKSREKDSMFGKMLSIMGALKRMQCRVLRK